MNPLLPGSYETGDLANRAESSGSTTSEENVFRIQYKQINGLPRN